MKKLIEEVEGEGLESLLGEKITLYCCRYIYTGKLIGVNESCVWLTDCCVWLPDCGIVYDTGSFEDKKWSDYQKLPHDWYVQKAAIESFGILK